MSKTKRLVVGMSGGSGAILGIRLLEVLKNKGWQVHLTLTEPAAQVVLHETQYSVQQLKSLAHEVHEPNDFFAPFASGSFETHGMVVVPCSMKTLAGIANGYAENLLQRSADVCLKERRKLVLVTREAPLSSIHLENMQKVTIAGGIILPPVLTFYTMPKSIDDLIDQVVAKTLQALGILSEENP